MASRHSCTTCSRAEPARAPTRNCPRMWPPRLERVDGRSVRDGIAHGVSPRRRARAGSTGGGGAVRRRRHAPAPRPHKCSPPRASPRNRQSATRDRVAALPTSGLCNPRALPTPGPCRLRVLQISPVSRKRRVEGCENSRTRARARKHRVKRPNLSVCHRERLIAPHESAGRRAVTFLRRRSMSGSPCPAAPEYVVNGVAGWRGDTRPTVRWAGGVVG
jgi:hypothetical protein